MTTRRCTRRPRHHPALLAAGLVLALLVADAASHALGWLALTAASGPASGCSGASSGSPSGWNGYGRSQLQSARNLTPKRGVFDMRFLLARLAALYQPCGRCGCPPQSTFAFRLKHGSQLIALIERLT